MVELLYVTPEAGQIVRNKYLSFTSVLFTLLLGQTVLEHSNLPTKFITNFHSKDNTNIINFFL